MYFPITCVFAVVPVCFQFVINKILSESFWTWVKYLVGVAIAPYLFTLNQVLALKFKEENSNVQEQADESKAQT